jgi:hypothetical protein
MPSQKTDSLHNFSQIHYFALAALLLVRCYAGAQACSWRTVPSPSVSGVITNFLFSVAPVASNDVWAVGSNLLHGATGYQTLTEHWDGTQWKIIPSPNQGSSTRLTSVAAASKNDVWAVGASETGGIFYAWTQRWNGRRWIAMPTSIQNADLNAVAAVSASDVWAVGGLLTGSNVIQPLIVHWDGRVWTQVAAPTFKNGATLLALSVVSAREIWAVGSSRGGGPSTLKWDGTQWNVVQPPQTGKARGEFYTVLSLASGDVWAGGQYKPSSRTTLMAHWDGTSWTVDPTGSRLGRIGYFFGLAASSPTDIWAVGDETGQNGVSQTILAHWDGSSWTPLSTQVGSDGTWLSSVTRVSGTGQYWAVGSTSGQLNTLTLSCQ